MRFFVPSHEIERQQEQVESLESELADFREIGMGNFEVARMLVEETITILGGRDAKGNIYGAKGLTTTEIAEAAYELVLLRRLEDARKELVTKYEQEERKKLYDRLLVETEQTEGESILQKVHERITTDPKEHMAIIESIRKELGARAVGIMHDKLTIEEQAVVDMVAERQLALDRLDIKFAYERELDLVSDDVIEALEIGDRLELFYEGAKKDDKPLIFTWTRDANDNAGWVWTEAGQNITTSTSKDYYLPTFSPKGDLFVSIGVVNRNLETGEEVIQPNRLAIGLPLVVINAQGAKLKPRVGTHDDYRREISNAQPLYISGTDFQTASLVFTRSTDRRS